MRGSGTDLPPPGYRVHYSPRLQKHITKTPDGDEIKASTHTIAVAAAYGHRRGLVAAKRIAEKLESGAVVSAIDQVLARRFA